MSEFAPGTSAEPLPAIWSAPERSPRLRLLVWGACLLAAAIVVGIVTTLVLRDRTATLSQAQNEAYTLATVLADHVDRVVENADLVIAQASAIAAPPGQPIATDVATWTEIKELKERSPYVSAIWIGDAGGNSVLTSYIHPSPRLNAANRDYVRFVQENPSRISITYVPRSLYANVPQIKITRRIGGPDEPYRGFITVDVSQQQFKALYSRLRIGDSVVIWLLDPNGQPLSRDPAGTPEQFSTPDWIPAILQGAPEGIVTANSPVTGEETLYVFRRSPTYGPVSLMTVPTRAVLQPWRERLWVYLALAAAALATIGVMGAGTLDWLARHQARSDELERRVQERTAELKDALKQKDVLVAELNHRVKNTLATVQSIARQTLRTSPDLKAFGHSFDERLLALSSTYALLTEADWTAASLSDLLKAELSPYLQGDGSRVRLEGPFIQLPPGLALSTGLVVHELTTNAAKYGALSTSSGRVDVTWTVEDRKDGWLLNLSWIETDGPAVAPPSRVGFGTRLMKTSFERVGGSVSFEYAPAGLRCFIEVPIPPPLPVSPVAIEPAQRQVA